MNFEREIKNDDGTEETIIISSNDNRVLNLNQTYKSANQTKKKAVCRTVFILQTG